MKTNVPTTRRGFTLVELLVVIVIIASLAGLTAPMVIRQRKKADQTQAVSNGKQIGLAMLEFDTDYGSYPGAATLTQLTAAGALPAIGAAGADSNGYFRQILQAGLTQSEEIFYCKAAGAVKPDNNITGALGLAANEVGFGYIANVNEGLSSSGNPARPLVIAPLTDGAVTLDPQPFDANLVALRCDYSCVSYKMVVAPGATVGTVTVGGAALLDVANTIWGGVAPTVKAPL